LASHSVVRPHFHEGRLSALSLSRPPVGEPLSVAR
jgi:hypothetical protein